MSKKCLTAPTILLLILLGSAVAWAQDPGEEKSFNLKHDASALYRSDLDDEDEVAEVYVPGIYGGDLECSVTLGFMDLATSLLKGEQLVYKFTDEATYWGDLDFQGESAFNPIVTLSYNLNPWFALEPHVSLSFSEYQTEITNRHVRANDDPEAPIENDPPLDEFDAEHRSVVTIHGGLAGLVYPFNIGDDGQGRWHPFLMGGVQRTWFDLNSNYTQGNSASWTTRFGAGFRFIADDLVSVRFQVAIETTTVEFQPSDRWESFNEGTLLVPVYEVKDGQFYVVDSFESQSVTSLSWGIGFTANF